MHASWVEDPNAAAKDVGRTKDGLKAIFDSVQGLIQATATFLMRPARWTVATRCADVAVAKPFATDVNLPRDPIQGTHIPNMHQGQELF